MGKMGIGCKVINMLVGPNITQSRNQVVLAHVTIVILEIVIKSAESK
jgi:hypothetical protein